MTVKVIDYREGVNSISLIIMEDSVLGFHPSANQFQFSQAAWKFFRDNFNDLLARDDRYATDRHDCMEDRRRISIEAGYDDGYSLSIYPGAYRGEWFVEFQEKGKTSPSRIVLKLRDSTGEGSTDYAEQIRKMLDSA